MTSKNITEAVSTTNTTNTLAGYVPVKNTTTLSTALKP
jgi:hypothetical protein